MRAQSLVEQDVAYGLSRHTEIVSRTTVVERGEGVDKLRAVIESISNTSMAKAAPVPQQFLYLLDSPERNAFATGGGRLYVTTSLLDTIGWNSGVLAFVIAHEAAHNILQHGLKKYLRAVERADMSGQFRYRIASGDKAAQWELLAFEIANPIASAKIERDEEHAADNLSLMMCAEAGYHPDFAILAERTLRARLGEQSKFAAFFSDHPRWTTREEKTEPAYEEALSIFTARWPSAELSPGGEPPVTIRSTVPVAIRRANGLLVSARISARHINGSPVSLTLLIYEKGGSTTVIAQKVVVADEARIYLNSFVSDRHSKAKRYVQVIAKSGADELFVGAVQEIK